MSSQVGECIKQDHAVTQAGPRDLLVFAFLLDLIGPCLVGHLEGVTLANSSKYCLATFALSKMILAERGSEVEAEVDGTASGGRFAKARSLGNMGRFSWVCFQT